MAFGGFDGFLIVIMSSALKEHPQYMQS